MFSYTYFTSIDRNTAIQCVIPGPGSGKFSSCVHEVEIRRFCVAKLS